MAKSQFLSETLGEAEGLTQKLGSKTFCTDSEGLDT
jgi:hypothetical protein